jgi:hypothetical protein
VSFSALYRKVGGRFRQRRRRWLFQQFQDCHTVVDPGGTLESWNGMRFPAILLVNVTSPTAPPPSGFQHVQADACETQLTAAFDLAFSNSAIEHVGTLERQRQFASEMMRLGRHIYCQTPNRWFPIEPHYLAVFVHWLPPQMFGHTLHRYLTLQGWAQRPTREQSMKIRQHEAIRFLSKRELRELFPGCSIRTERVLGLAKSYTVWR